MIGLIRLLLRFAWLTLFVLGLKRALEIVQGGVDLLTERIESGEQGGVETALVRLHAALHRRQAHDAAGGDAFGEM